MAVWRPADGFKTVVPNWKSRRLDPAGRDKTLRVIEIRPASGAEDEPALVVEHV
jgi:hypothetical protein